MLNSFNRSSIEVFTITRREAISCVSFCNMFFNLETQDIASLQYNNPFRHSFLLIRC